MYSKAATAAAILAFIAATEAKMDVAQIKKVAQRDAARVQARQAKLFNGKMAKAARLGRAVQTSPTYVSLNLYSTTDCSNAQPTSSVIYGTNMCLAISSSTGITASSTQYTWDSTNNILNEVYYSDSACSTAVGQGQVIDFGTTAVSTCFEGYEYTTSSSYAFPGTGYAVQEFTSSSTCSSNTPYMSVWVTTVADDDTVTIDDGSIVTIGCTATTTSGESSLDDDTADDFAAVTFDADIYMSISTGASSGGSSSSNSCFAGSESVMMADGSVKAISEVAVGDSILAADASGNAKFSKVIAVPHDRNSELATFTQLSTAAGDIKMTAEHLVMVDEACNGAATLKAASSVEAGMCLVSTNGSQAVESVKTVQGRGIYSVVTEEEFVVVNGFVASPFAVNHAVANAYYNVIRAVPALMNFDVVKQASMMFGSLAESMSA